MSAVPADQAARLRAMMQPAAAQTPALRLADRPARVIAIASGKGGVGKTSIAVNLSLLLARQGNRVLLLDADLGTANADILLNVQSRWDLSHVIRGQRKLSDISVCIEAGLHLIPGASGLSAAADMEPRLRSSLLAELARLESAYDLVVVDCGAGVASNVTTFAGAADDLLVIATPEPTAIADAYALIKIVAAKSPMPRLSLVVNQVGGEKEGRVVYQRIAQTAERFLGLRIRMAGHIPRDEAVPESVLRRSAFVVRYPRCPAASCLAILARGVARDEAGPAARSGFFDRLLAFFC